MDLKGVWLVDADIRGFYDHVPRGPLREIMQRRVNDGGLLRLIGKWLHAGIQEGDHFCRTSTCTRFWMRGSWRRCSLDSKGGRS